MGTHVKKLPRNRGSERKHAMSVTASSLASAEAGGGTRGAEKDVGCIHVKTIADGSSNAIVILYDQIHMKQYQSFIFDSYDFDEQSGKIELHYSLDDEVHFTETVTIPGYFKKQVMNPTLESALFALHLIGGISYYKTCLPKKIEIRSGKLSKEQAAFWNAVYENGLGEFFYKNKIDFQGLIDFPVSEDAAIAKPQAANKSPKKVLVPIGGGKDSVVTIEKLRAEGADMTLLRLGHHPLIDAMVRVTKLPTITVKRQLSAELFELNEQGALNGHIPITAYLSALCVVIAELSGFDGIAMSNEKSANEGNVEYLGKKINHQWSKSAEFETMFQQYIANIGSDVRYWSPLREMTELEVVKEFVKHQQYFEVFTSCNKNWKIAGERQKQRWCNTCPKCAFVFALMAAYLPRAEVEQIFGGNPMNDESVLPLYKQLLGLEGCKPFECVGVPEETKEAFTMINERGDFEGTPAMNLFLQNT